MCLAMEKSATSLYVDHYIKTHKTSVLPMKWSEIVEVFQHRGDDIPDPEELGYNEATGLCSKCCMSRDCPHYLIPNKSLSLHLETDRKSGNFVEAFHRCIRELRHQSLEVIERALISGEYMVREPKSTYSDLFASDYGPSLRADIRAVRDKYIEIFA